MVIEPEDRVTDIIAAVGGRLVSRVRLQKIVYLLDRLGADVGFDFSYHHFGPYSRELEGAIADAKAFRKVEEQIGYRSSDGARYSVFLTLGESSRNSFLSDELQHRARELVTENVTVLELAATAHWLVVDEKVSDWKQEIMRRKGAKTSDGRLDRAVALLGKLGLEPASFS